MRIFTMNESEYTSQLNMEILENITQTFLTDSGYLYYQIVSH